MRSQDHSRRAPESGPGRGPLTLVVGDEELVICRRYEALSIANDVLVAVWFAVGSVLFFSEATTTVGTWLFLLGSVELMIRPVIRLSRHLHLQGLPRRVGYPPESTHDF